MLKQTFMTSLLTFYMKAEVGIEGAFIKLKNPNSILKFIPLGAHKVNVPMNSVSSVESSFRLDFKSLLWGLVVVLFGFSAIGNNPLSGIVLLVYGALTVISSFETLFTIVSNSGKKEILSVIVFEKSKVEDLEKTLENLINKRYEDTNVAKGLEKSTSQIVDAIKSNKE